MESFKRPRNGNVIGPIEEMLRYGLFFGSCDCHEVVKVILVIILLTIHGILIVM